MNPLVSVIVPAYNAERYVERCLSALLSQSYQNIEIIIVDDGSKDRTFALCKSWEAKYNKVRAFTQENRGASSARNLGLSKCSGAYVAFIDVDDMVFTDYIAYLYQLIKKYDADVSMCACYKMNTSEKIPAYFKEKAPRVLSREEAVKSLFYRRGITGYPYLKLWKREIIKGGTFPEDMLYGEDFVYAYEMLKRCHRVVYGEKVEYIYYQNPGSINRNTNYTQLVHCWSVFSKQIMQDIKKHFPELVKAAIAKNFIFALDFYNRIDKRKDEYKLRDKLRYYVKRYGVTVFVDKDCKILNRILGVIGWISPTVLFFLCRRFYDIKRIFHFEVRKSV